MQLFWALIVKPGNQSPPKAKVATFGSEFAIT